MDISSRFSLVDFLAYFFPGIIASSGIYLILLQTSFQESVKLIKFDLTLAVLLLAISYVIGVILSGFTEVVIQKWRASKNKEIVKSTLPVPEFRQEITDAFNSLFGLPEKREWSIANFYLCRSLIAEVMPRTADLFHRQSSLRQLRMNLIPSTAIWFIAGIISGIAEIVRDDIIWGIILVALSVIFLVIITTTLLNRMKSNEVREVREVLTAFLAGYRAGLFKSKM